MNRILLVCEKEKSAQALQTLLNRFLQAEIVRASQLQQAQALLSREVFVWSLSICLSTEKIWRLSH